MAISHTDTGFSALGTAHSFPNRNLGAPRSGRYILIGINKADGFSNAMTVTVGAVTAVECGSINARASQGLIHFLIAPYPDDEMADVNVTFTQSARCFIGLWRITGLVSPFVTNIMWANALNGTVNFAPLTTVAGGVAVGMARLRHCTGWVGLPQEFNSVDGSWRRTGASLATDGSSIATPNNGGCGFNVNAVWQAVAFATGGLPDDDTEEVPRELNLEAEVSPSIHVTLAVVNEDDPGDPNIDHPPDPCPIPGLGSEVCITGSTAIPAGYSQVLCGQAEYEDPCD